MKKSEYSGEKIQTWDFISFNLFRSNNTGNPVVLKKNLYELENGLFVQKKRLYSEAVVKLIDEIITNAIDAVIKNKATIIKVSYNNGKICVINNGPGIPIYLDDDDCYSVQNGLTKQYSSTNYNDSELSVTGGLNGCGAKMTNIYSKSFFVETVCSKQQIVYKQLFEQNIRKINPPTIEKYTGQSYTRITFELDYDICCKISKDTPNKNWLSGENIELIKKIIERRCYESAVYLSCFSNAKICFNDQHINVKFSDFCKKHGTPAICTRMLNTEANLKYNFNVGLIFKTPVKVGNTYETAGFNHVTIINSVVVEELPNFVEIILKKLENFIRNHKDVETVCYKSFKGKQFPTRLMRENITIVTVCQYPKKFFDFKGQAKTGAQLDTASLKDFAKYEFGEAFLNAFWEQMKEIFKFLVTCVNKVNKKAKIKLYEPSISHKGEGLFVGEGNSAVTLLRKMIEYCPSLSREKFGIYTIQGKPMNALKHSEVLPSGIRQLDKLVKNDGLQALVNCLGLNYTSKKMTRYSYIILATDQDLDGGHICSLLICFFVLYFPDLVREGVLRRFRTPIIRATHKKIIYEFFSEKEFEEKNKEMGGVLKGFYYKGLGTHDKEDIVKMAKTFSKNLVKINYDEAGEILMNTLFNKDTNKRKEEILKYIPQYYYVNPLSITLTEHFMNEALPQQLDNIKRMCPSIFDGLNPVQRKTFATTRKFPQKKPTKVTALVGKVIGEMNYDHGEASLEGAIMRMAQIFPGSNRAPIILPVSDSNGNQWGGTKDVASARYTKIIDNPFMDFYYPRCDDDLLEKVEEEGNYYEPKYYVPIVPRILLEDTNAILTGWSSTFTARRFDIILMYTRLSIRYYPKVQISELMGLPEVYENMCVITHEDKEICLGTYQAKDKQIIVTQLPLGLWGKKFVKQLELKTDLIESVHNATGVNLCIVIKLHYSIPETIKLITRTKFYMDPITEFLGLYKIFTRNLNFYGKESLQNFTKISDIFKIWFEERRSLYIARIEKQIVQHEAHLLLLEGIYHFIVNDKGQIDKKTNEERDNVLANTLVDYSSGTKPYVRLNDTKILTTQQLSAKDLYDEIYTVKKKFGGYKYIYNIKKSDTSEENIKKLKEQIEQLKTRKFYSWQETWLNELDVLEDKYNYAKKVNWFYKEF